MTRARTGEGSTGGPAVKLPQALCCCFCRRVLASRHPGVQVVGRQEDTDNNDNNESPSSNTFLVFLGRFLFLAAPALGAGCVLNRRKVATDRRSGNGIFPGKARAPSKIHPPIPPPPTCAHMYWLCVSESERSERLRFTAVVVVL